MAVIDPLTTELAEVFTEAGYLAVALDPVPPSVTGIVDVSDHATGHTVVVKLHPDRGTGLWHSTGVDLGIEAIVGFFPLRNFEQVVWSIGMTYPETAP